MRQVMRLSQGWKFHLGEVENGGYKGLEDKEWKDVVLPHDWSVEHPFENHHSSGTGYLPGGVGWYRLRFTMPPGAEGRNALLTFEGVYRNARVWVNSNYLGKRPYGYSTFSNDITGFLSPGENVVAVRAEHTDLADSRWFTGAGMTRGVTLTCTDNPHFPEYGVFVSTVKADDDAAELSIKWELNQPGDVEFALLDAQGNEVSRSDAAGLNGEAWLQVDEPRLWSPDAPYLYTLVARASESGEFRDEIQIQTGIRTFRFDANKGFFLNGKNMKLKGVCLHHDAGALGAAVPENVWGRRLYKLKQCGCNAIRTSHNPPDPGLLSLCDRMGFLVMDEAFDEWEGCKNKWWQGHNVYPPKHFGYADDFPQWYEQDLAGMVRRDRNHPSIILWSIGNEIDYPNDPYVHSSFASMTGNNDANKPAQERRYDPNKPDAKRLATVAKELVRIVKQHDTTRPVTSALAFPELSTLTGYAQALDVAGYNYKEQFYEEHHSKFPGMVILGAENGTRAEAWFPVKRLPYISGQFLWTGVDYLGEAKGWPIRLSPAGLLDTAGNEKSLWAQRRALWSGEKTARLAVSAEGDVWHERFGWFGRPGEMRHVSLYTNAPKAELFLNGESLGIKEVGEDCAARWEVTFAHGSLRGVAAWEDGSAMEDRLASPTGTPQPFLSRVEKTAPADGVSVIQFEVTVRDEFGIPVTDDDIEVTIAVTNGTLLGIENGRPDDLTPYFNPTRHTWRGRLIAYVRVGDRPGIMTVKATADGGAQDMEVPLTEAHRHEG